MGISCLWDLRCVALCGVHRPGRQYLKQFQAKLTGSSTSFPFMEIVGKLFAWGRNRDEDNLPNNSLCGLKWLVHHSFCIYTFPSSASQTLQIFRRNKSTCIDLSAGNRRRNICSTSIREKSQAVVDTTRPWLLTVLSGLR